jgi:hypothetical protein
VQTGRDLPNQGQSPWPAFGNVGSLARRNVFTCDLILTVAELHQHVKLQPHPLISRPHFCNLRFCLLPMSCTDNRAPSQPRFSEIFSCPSQFCNSSRLGVVPPHDTGEGETSFGVPSHQLKRGGEKFQGILQRKSAPPPPQTPQSHQARPRGLELLL